MSERDPPERSWKLELKRLGFVAEVGDVAFTTSESLYRRFKALTPGFAAAPLSQIEGVASSVAPSVVRVGEQLLLLADAHMDNLVTAADKTISQGRDGVSQTLKTAQNIKDVNLQRCATAFETYLSYLTKAGDYAVIIARDTEKMTLDGVQAARDRLQATVEKARQAADPDVGLAMAWDAWTKFASYPSVAKLLETAEPATKLGLQTFHALHDTLVVSSLYKALVNRTAGTFSFAASTTPYKLGALYLYPFVQPLADPAINTVSQSKIVNQVVDYWKPVEQTPVSAH